MQDEGRSLGNTPPDHSSLDVPAWWSALESPELPEEAAPSAVMRPMAVPRPTPRRSRSRIAILDTVALVLLATVLVTGLEGWTDPGRVLSTLAVITLLTGLAAALARMVTRRR